MRNAITRKVRRQQRLFNRRFLPGLLEQHRGEWVVFHDGTVRSLHNTVDEAHVAAIDEFGVDAGFVIAPVEEVKPIHVTGTAASWLAAATWKRTKRVTLIIATIQTVAMAAIAIYANESTTYVAVAVGVVACWLIQRTY